MKLRSAILPGLTILGVVALVVVPLVRPDRTNHPRDPVARAFLDLLAIEPGMIRDVVDKHAVFVFRKPNSTIDIFRHPRTEFLRLEIRFSGPAGTDRVIEVSDPYLAPTPSPRRLP